MADNVFNDRNKRFGDSLTNFAANLAVGNAKTANDQFQMRYLQYPELIAMYRGDWMSRKIVDLVPKDAVRPWRDWQTKGVDTSKIEEAEKRHKVKSKIAQAFRWARLEGGAAILVSNGDEDPSKPMTAVGKGRLEALTVLHTHELTPQEIIRDARSEEFRNPEYYQLNIGARGSQRLGYIHHSRVIRFVGMERPDHQLNPQGWGDSVLQIVYDAVHHAALTNGAIAELIHEAKVDVIKIKGLTKHLSSPKDTELISKRFDLVNSMKAINNMLLLDGEDEWDRKQTSFAGLPDILQSYMQIVAGAADIPATRLLGKSPDGMNSTGDSDTRNYHEMLDGWRDDELRPVLDKVDGILWQDATGGDTLDARYEFGDIKEPTETEKADIAAKKAETTKKYFDMGVFDDEAFAKVVTNQLIEDATYPGMEDAIDELQSRDYDADDEDGDADQGAGNRAAGNRADDSLPARYRKIAASLNQ